MHAITDPRPPVEFHTEVEAELDPVTFEVIRNRLWNTNLAAGQDAPADLRLAVSSRAWTSTWRPDRGRRVGDERPVHHLPRDGRRPSRSRTSWSTSSEHPGSTRATSTSPATPGSAPRTRDGRAPGVRRRQAVRLGLQRGTSTTSAGSCRAAGRRTRPTSSTTTIVFSPFKIVERGVLRTDLEEMYRRQSRMPDLVALDLRAQISGLHYAEQEMLKMCEQFGAPTVKAAMRKVLDDAQQAFAAKLERIPDGTWSESAVHRREDARRPRELSRAGQRDQARRPAADRQQGGTDPQAGGPDRHHVRDTLSGAVLGTRRLSRCSSEHLLRRSAGSSRQNRLTTSSLGTPWTIVDHPAPVAGGVNDDRQLSLNSG